MPRDAFGVEQRAMMNVSRYGLARANVIVMRNIELSLPYAGAINDEVFALAFTDFDAAQRRFGDDAAAEPMSLTVAELVGVLAPDWGLIIDPDDDPIVVPAGDKKALLLAGASFPPGADVTLAPADHALAPFVAAVASALESARGIYRTWVVRYALDTLPPEVLVLVEASNPESAEVAARAVAEVAQQKTLAVPVRTLRIETIPPDFALWVRRQEATVSAEGS